MEQTFKFIARPNSLTLIVDGVTYVTNQNIEAVKSLILENKIDDAIALINQVNLPKGSDKKLVNSVSTEDSCFEIIDNLLYMKGIDVPVPKAIVNAWTNGSDEYKQSVENFWKLLVLNPNIRVRNELCAFLENTGFVLSKNGLIVTLRQGYKEQKTTTELVDVANPYEDLYRMVRKQWHKNPQNFYVHTDGNTFKVSSRSLGAVGNLAELYTKYNTKEEVKVSTSEVWYKAAHHSKHVWYLDGTQYTDNMYYQVGKTTRIPKEYCDTNSRNTCSKGIHSAAWSYNKKSFSYGDTNLLCLVNPYDVLSVPEDGAQKIRSTSIYIVKELSQEEYEGYKEKSLEVLDDEHFNNVVEEMEQMISEKLYSTERDGFVPEEYTVNQIKSVKEMLNSAKVSLEKRVVVSC